MKKFLAVAVLALIAGTAYAYQTTVGVDPTTHADQEFKTGIKSTVGGVSDAITGTNELLTYSSDKDGYHVTRVGNLASTITGSALIAGVGTKAVATGDGPFLVQTKGYATVKYDSTVGVTGGVGGGIVQGDRLCGNAVGAAVPCSGAASHSKVIALESKAQGTGTDLKVLINAE